MRQKSLPEKEPATQVVKNIRRVWRTLEKIGIPRATFYRWYDLYAKADSSTSRMISSFSEAGTSPRRHFSAKD